MKDDYSKEPQSITELRSDKNLSQSKPEWGVRTPRDCLIEMLRDIDSGKLKVKGIAICYSFENENDLECTGGISAGASFVYTVGLVARHLHAMQQG